MSIFKTAEQWPDTYKACGAPHQSPINLSRTFALPCDRLCELQIDAVSVPQAKTSQNTSTGSTDIVFDGVKPTARFNGEGYTCQTAGLLSSGQHTIENVRAEAEFIALFTNPTGKQLAISVAVRPSPGETPASSFFNAFVPFAQSTTPTQVVLGRNWQFQNIIPENKGFYTYEGSWITPECQPNVTWVVFAQSVNMDPSDYAKIARSGGGYRPLQPVADRQVFFNDGEKVDKELSKEFQNHDGKTYMRCRRIPKKGESEQEVGGSIRASNLSEKEQKAINDAATRATNNIQAQMNDFYTQMGSIWGVLAILLIMAFAYFVFFTQKGDTLMEGLFRVLVYPFIAIHSFVFGKTSSTP